MNDKDLRTLIRCWSGEGSRRDQSAAEKIKGRFPQEYAALEETWNMELFAKAEFEKQDHKDLVLEHKQRERNSSHGIFLSYRVLSLAALILLLLFVGGSTLFVKLVPKNIENLSQEKQEYLLPDQSKVILDQGASLSYRTTIYGKFSRECQLEGRAHFQVRHDDIDDFLIRTTYASIRVLGTQFTVSTLQDRMQLILDEGSVKVVSLPTGQQAILTRSGEQLIAGSAGIEKQNLVNSALYLSWMEDKLQFNNCTIEEALDFLEDTWGTKLVLPDTVSADYRLMGTAPTGDPALIVEAIHLIIGD